MMPACRSKPPASAGNYLTRFFVIAPLTALVVGKVEVFSQLFELLLAEVLQYLESGSDTHSWAEVSREPTWGYLD